MTTVITCPKCGAISGDDWSQCRGACPMAGSPHFKAELVIQSNPPKRIALPWR